MLIAAAVEVLPRWLAQRGDHVSIEGALAVINGDEALKARFLGEIAAWGLQERAAVLPVIERWAREDEAWEDLFVALGGAVPPSGTDPIPEDWPEDWRTAALDFRDTGRIDTAWPPPSASISSRAPHGVRRQWCVGRYQSLVSSPHGSEHLDQP